MRINVSMENGDIKKRIHKLALMVGPKKLAIEIANEGWGFSTAGLLCNGTYGPQPKKDLAASLEKIWARYHNIGTEAS
jgi:hypothetical protein